MTDNTQNRSERFSTQLDRMKNAPGFIAALDQSGGSTPKALAAFGIGADRYSSEDEMFDLIHQMRTRIMTSPAFTSEKILGAILFEQTMDRQVDGVLAADYLWEQKGVVPFLKVDKGLAELADGVQLMKPIPGLDTTLEHALSRNVFGTKMRSVIKEANPAGIAANVAQQFEIGAQIVKHGLVPILEPEVDINCPDKEAAEEILLEQLKSQLAAWTGEPLLFKLTIPSVAGLYSDLMTHPAVVRIVALSGGYSRDEANQLLAQNPGLIASFSRALTEGLTDSMASADFDSALAASIDSIFQASIA